MESVVHALFFLASSAGLLVLLLVSLGRFLDKRRLPSTSADAALVFGTGLEWKAQARWITAARLFGRGRVNHVIVSGGVPMPGVGMTEAEWLRLKLIGRGVPSDRILVENEAANTAENAAFALPLIQQHGFRSVVLVMSDFGGIRAHLTARRAWKGSGIQIFDCHAPSPGRWDPRRWWLTPEGRRLTWGTVSRLLRYRLLRYLFTPR